MAEAWQGPWALARGARGAAKSFAQCLFMAAGFFARNGLTNHAAAVAYGFLLSAAPMLLLASFFLIRAMRAAPEAAMALLHDMPFLDFALDEGSPALEFLIHAPPGIPAAASMLSILWAGRLFALSMQRGLNVVFSGPGRRNPALENLVTLAIEFSVLAVMLAAILASRPALRLYGAEALGGEGLLGAGLPPFLTGLLGSGAFRLAALGLFLYLAYRLIPANRPRRSAALCGSAFCAAAYAGAAALMGALMAQPRHAFLYGGLGDIIIALVGVYFFFLFFFLGAQFAAVANSFEALLFLRLREARSAGAARGMAALAAKKVMGALFFFAGGSLEKYLRAYAPGQDILRKGEAGGEVYFILEGEADALLPAPGGCEEAVGSLKAGAFIGEMGHLLCEGRSATIRARTEVSALELPPALFDAILGADSGLDRSIIESLTRRIKKGNEQIAALSAGRAREGSAG